MRLKTNGQLRVFLLAVLGALGLYSGAAWSQSVEPGIEVKLEGADFTQVTDRLFGTGGLLNQTEPFEFKAEGLVLTQ